MTGPMPRDLDRKRLRALLRAAPAVTDLQARLEWVSRQWLGYPYLECPLGGSADQSEIFTASLGGFDCVTYVETVLALSESNTVVGFVDTLRSIRYRKGEVAWKTRNHYMSAWIRANQTQGFVTNLTRGPNVVRRVRRLKGVPGLPERNVSIASIPKYEFIRRSGDVETGDLIFFASTRKNLDVFHCGVLVRSDGDLLIRHAARSKGAVVEQDLLDFLRNNRMVGVILVRPQSVFSRVA